MKCKEKIPKVIHYCWFGGNPLPDLAKQCIESWKKYCPDYEIKEWNENNFPLNYCAYVREAYEAGKWAFVSDVARLYALVTEGGIYMDTDVEVIKPLDDLLNYEAVSGFESETQIPTGLMASIPDQILFKELLKDYDTIHFKRSDGTYNLETNVTKITRICLKYGLKQDNTLQTVQGFTLLPKDYLCPKNHETKDITITKNTLTIHHFDGSWHSEEDKYFEAIKKKLPFFLKNQMGYYFCKFVSLVKYHGFFIAIKRIIGWVSN